MNARTYLVTGAAGFIGSHVVERLLARGDRVVGLDNFDTVYQPDIKRRNIARVAHNANYTLVRGDICDETLLAGLLATHRPDVVIHLAARAGVRPSIDDPMSYIAVNITGTGAVLHQAKLAGISHVVLASSSSVYGANSVPPFREDEIADRPSSLYAATKRANELAAYTYHHLHGMTLACLRFFTVYGPRQRPEMAIHKFTRLIDSGAEVPMFGAGATSRDYTYVDDIVTGVVASADRPLGFRIYNLGTTDTVGLRPLIDMIAERLGKPARIKELPVQDGDVPLTHADISLAAQDLDYRPTTKIAEGLDRFVDWYSRVAAGLPEGPASALAADQLAVSPNPSPAAVEDAMRRQVWTRVAS
jgi:UDP-glucuronate 4-epimerase